MKATKTATEALRRSREESGLTEEAVEAAREALAEELDEQELLTQGLTTPVAEIDGEELEKELQALENEMAVKEGGKKPPTPATISSTSITTAALVESMPDISGLRIAEPVNTTSGAAVNVANKKQVASQS